MVKFEKPKVKKFNNGDKVVYMDVYVDMWCQCIRVVI